MRHRDSHTVAVRVGGQQKVRLFAFAQIQAFLQRLTDLRVRIRTGREIAVRHLLFFYRYDILHANAVENRPDAHIARAVQRRVNHFHAAVRANAFPDGLAFHRVQIPVNHFLFDILDFPLGQRLVKVRDFDAVKNINFPDFFQNRICRLIGHLAAVRAISLVTVVFGGIVAGGDHHARLAFQIPHRERQRRCRHQLIVQISGNAVSRHDPGSLFGEQPGIDAGIIGNRNACRRIFFIEIIRHALGRFANRINVHPVGACAQYAAQPRGTEGQLLIKPVENFFLFAFYAQQFLFQRRVLQREIQPTLILHIFCHIDRLRLFINIATFYQYSVSTDFSQQFFRKTA